MVRVAGLGSELPLASTTASDATYVPGFENVTAPGFWAVDLAGVPPGNTHPYLAALVVVLNDTDPPAGIVTSAEGDVIAPSGGGAVTGVSLTNWATEGTPALSSRNNM